MLKITNGIHHFPLLHTVWRKKPASSLVFLGKALNGTPPSLCTRPVMGTRSLLLAVTNSGKRFESEPIDSFDLKSGV